MLLLDHEPDSIALKVDRDVGAALSRLNPRLDGIQHQLSRVMGISITALNPADRKLLGVSDARPAFSFPVMITRVRAVMPPLLIARRSTSLAARLSRRSAIAILFAGAGLLLRGSVARADHDYVAVVTNTQLGPDGTPGMVGLTLVIEERPASPKFIEGCHGVLMPAFHVRVTDEGRQQTRLLMGIDPTFHPDPPAPEPVRPGDRFVVEKTGSGDCGDGTSLLYLRPAPPAS